MLVPTKPRLREHQESMGLILHSMTTHFKSFLIPIMNRAKALTMKNQDQKSSQVESTVIGDIFLIRTSYIRQLRVQVYFWTYHFFQTWNIDKPLRWFESSHQSGIIRRVFERIWENVEGQFDLQNSGPSEVGFERPILYFAVHFFFPQDVIRPGHEA